MYFLNKFKYVNVSIFVISGILLVAMSLIPVTLPAFVEKLLGTTMMLPFLGTALTMVVTKFQTGPSKPPKAFGVAMATIGAFATVIITSCILSFWINIPQETAARFELPFVYVSLLAVILTVGGRMIAKNITNPLLILD